MWWKKCGKIDAARGEVWEWVEWCINEVSGRHGGSVQIRAGWRGLYRDGSQMTVALNTAN